MEAIFIYAIIAAILFAVVFVTKKQFGLLGLALAAGSILSGVWINYAEQIMNKAGFINSPMMPAIIAVAFVLAPSLILLLHGYNNKTLVGQVFSAGLFSILAITLLIDPISRVFVPQNIGVDIYNLVLNNQSFIIGICLIIAVIDLFFTRPASAHEKKSKH
jgi:hypothetical protein